MSSLERRYRLLLRATRPPTAAAAAMSYWRRCLRLPRQDSTIPPCARRSGCWAAGSAPAPAWPGGCTPWGLWAEGLRLGALLLLVSLTGDAASATWLQTNHLVFTWIFSNAAGWR